MSLSTGVTLGSYEIVAPLGAGGMGEVFKARDARLGRDVAIKILPAHLSTDPVARERMRREAMAAAALDHPFICKVYEIGEAPLPAAGGDALFIVMEFVRGETLHTRIASGPVPLAEAMAMISEIV